jgi:prepilin-type N-terminal cleavage/methylation domain-containing protein
MNLPQPIVNKAFTLIELLVVVVIIGILSSVGIYAFSNFTNSGKKSATIANWNQASKYIQNIFGQCQLKGNQGTILLSVSSGSINCADLGDKTSVNNIADTFRRYFLEINFKNPYDPSATGDSIIIRTGSGSVAVGALRLDETQCPAGAVAGNNTYSKARMILWYKTHDEEANTIFEMGNWCR